MKLRALTNLGGIVQALSGQEFEVTNQAQARDLIQQGVAIPVDNTGAEVQALLNNQDSEKMAFEYEMAAIERSECELAYSEAVQKEVNRLEDQKQQSLQKVKDQAKQQAEQKVQQMAKQQEMPQSSPSQVQSENQLNQQGF